MQEVNQAIDVGHLGKELQQKKRKIESKYKSSFATTSHRTGQFLGFLYDIPLENLPKTIIDKKRRYEPQVIDQVSETLNQLLDEQILCEATNPQVVSNLLPVQKSLGEKELNSKIDKYLNRKDNKQTDKTRAVTDVRFLNSLLPTPQAWTLPKLNEMKTNLIDHYLITLDISNMYFSIQITEKTSNFLCFHSLNNSKIYRFKRLIQGLKISPSVAAGALKMAINTQNFKTFLEEMLFWSTY